MIVVWSLFDSYVHFSIGFNLEGTEIWIISPFGDTQSNVKVIWSNMSGSKVQISSYKINKSWGYNVQHGDYSFKKNYMKFNT